MAHISKKIKRDGDLSTHNTDTFNIGKTQGRKCNTEEIEKLDQSIGKKHPRLVVNSESDVNASIFLVPQGIQSKRYQLIRNFASKNGFQCQENISDGISHVVSDLTDISQLSRLYPKLLEYFDLKIVSIQWLHTCAREKSLVPEESFLVPGFQQWLALRKQKAQAVESHTSGTAMADTVTHVMEDEARFTKDLFNENILERNAPLKHCNQKLVEPLVFLHEYWTVMGDEKRALAYAKAGATIKCLPFTVTSMNELDDLKGLGSGHSLKVIQEMLETANCQEVTVKKNSEKFLILKNLSTVYGIGPSLALRLHVNHDVKSVQDLVMQWSHLSLADERIKVGVAYHADLNEPVSKDIAEKIMEIVKAELSKIKEGHHLELAGGFRRGKTGGHDVDLLISYSKNGDELGVLSKLMKQLNQKGYILQSRFEKSSFDEEAVFRKNSDQVTTMDHFEKCFCIFRCPLQDSWISDDGQRDMKLDFDSLLAASHMERDWRAVRVDLVVIPKSQWAYALLGWTGSKLYMRMLRHYSNKVLHRSLNSHGMWDVKEQRLLPAESEEEVFRHLGLSFKDPVSRNF